jgi:hypothetical protein
MDKLYQQLLSTTSIALDGVLMVAELVMVQLENGVEKLQEIIENEKTKTE